MAWDETTPPVEVLKINISDLAIALSAATNAAMPYPTCLTYAMLYMYSTASGGNLSARSFVANLPAYHRRATDELLGVGLSLAVALNKGCVAFASKSDYDLLMAPFGVPWTRPWKGEDGPDFLTLDANQKFAFLEIKGRAKVCTRTPVSFGTFKAQSLNAKLSGIPTRHVLSYAYLPSGTKNDNALVRWFNANAAESRPGSRQASPAKIRLAELAVAYCHFQAILRNAGRTMPPDLTEIESEDWYWNQQYNVWEERGPMTQPKLFVPFETSNLFDQTRRLFETLRTRSRWSESFSKTIESLHARWMALQGARDALGLDELTLVMMTLENDFYFIHRYANGVCILAEGRDRRRANEHFE